MGKKERKKLKFAPKSLKNLPFYLRFFVIFGFFFALFILFLVVAVLIFFGITLFKEKIEIKGDVFAKYKDAFSLEKFNCFGFNNVVVHKSKESFFYSDVIVSEFDLKDEYFDLEVKKIDFQIAPLEIFSSHIVKSLRPIRDLSLNIDLENLVAENKKEKARRHKSIKKSSDYFNEFKSYANTFGRYFTNFVLKYSSIIENKIVFENAKIVLNFVRGTAENSKTEFNILDSKTLFLKKKEINALGKKFSELSEYSKQVSRKQKNRLSEVTKNGFFLLNQDGFKVLSSKTNFIFGEKKVGLEMLCRVEFQNKISCVVYADNLPINFFGSYFEEYFKNLGLQNLVSGSNAVDAKLFFKIDNGNIKNLRLKASLNTPEGLDIGDFNSSVERIGLFLEFEDRFNNVISSEMLLNNKDGSSIRFNLGDFSVKRDNSSFVIKTQFNDVELSNLLRLKLRNTEKEGLQIPIQGKINGALSFVFKNGTLQGSFNELSNLSLSNFSIKLYGVKLDFSRINFNISLVGHNVMISSKKSNENGSFNIEYRLSDNIIKLHFENFKIDKDGFRDFRNLITGEQMSFLLEDFDYSFLMDGAIYLPIYNGSPRLMSVSSDLRVLLSEEEVFKKNNDNIVINIKKAEEQKNCNVVVDFANTKMQSSLYKFLKSRKDKSVILMDFLFDDKNNIGLKGVWKFNDKNICDFSALGKESVIKVNIDGERFNVNINVGEGRDIIKISGENTHIDKVFAKSLVFLVKELADYFATDEDIIVEVDVQKAKLDDIVVEKIFANLRVNSNKIFGDCLISLEDGDVIYYSNNNEGLKFYSGNFAQILHVLGIAEELDVLRIEASGKVGRKVLNIKSNNDEASIGEDGEANNFGKLAIDMKYKGANLFQTTRPNSIYSDKLRFVDGGIEILDTKISGNWFDIIGDLNVNFDGSMKLEGKLKPYLPSDRFKQFFVSRKEMTKGDGYKFLKQGKDMDEFNRSFFVNDIDFSADKNGNVKNSFTSWVMDNG